MKLNIFFVLKNLLSLLCDDALYPVKKCIMQLLKSVILSTDKRLSWSRDDAAWTPMKLSSFASYLFIVIVWEIKSSIYSRIHDFLS